MIERMDRRVFLVAAAGLTLPLAAEGQQTWRVGILAPGSARPGTLPTIVVESLQQALKDLGYIESRNITFETRRDEARRERFEKLARDLVELRVNVIVAGTSQSAVAAKQATTTIAIVMAATGGDPVALGLIASHARPGGNVTGVILQTHELPGKKLQFLKELLPRISCVGLFWHPGQPRSDEISAHERAARTLGFHVQPVEAIGPEDFDRAFAVAAR